MYKPSRFKTAFKALFNLKGLEKEIFFHTRKECTELEKILEEQFYEKLQFLRVQNLNGITNSVKLDKIYIAQVPTATIDMMRNNFPSSQSSFNAYEKEVKTLSISYSDSNHKLETFKHAAAYELANKLIDMGYLKNEMFRDQIRFYINMF